MKKTVISLFLSVILTASSFAAISPVLRYCNAGTFDLWTEEAYYCSPVVTDLDGDGENEIIYSYYTIIVRKQKGRKCKIQG